MSHVFISHKSEDFNLTTLMRMQLERDQQIRVWIDNMEIRASEKWSEQIDRAIKESFAVVVILTPRALNSDFITYEWSYALGAGIPVVPVIMEHINLNELHPKLKERHLIDYYNHRSHDFRELIQTLHTLRATPQANLPSAIPKVKFSEADASPLYTHLKLMYDLQKPIRKDNYLAVLAKLGYITKDELVRLQKMERNNPSA